MHRKILHVDMDAFFASVEQRDSPQLRGRPVAVGSGTEARATVTATSEEARKQGVRVGMSTKTALQRCPELVIVPLDFDRYRNVSQQLHAILGDFTARIESPALDRVWLDLTDPPKEPGLAGATAAARRIRERVRRELDLTCSIGVAPNKFVAQVASTWQKPNGLTVIPPDQVSAFLHPLPVDRLSGVGKATARRLGEHGVHTIGDLAKLTEAQAVAVLGRAGSTVWRTARGEDPRTVNPDRGRRSRGAERTFPLDLLDRAAIEREVERQIRSLAEDLAAANERARTVTVRIRYAGFEATSRTRTLDQATRDPAKLALIARGLLYDRTEVGVRAVRLVGVSLTGLATAQRTDQLDLPLPSRRSS